MNRNELIGRICEGKPRVHATGFAQLYISPDTRLHVWTDALLARAPDIKQIVFKHDHRYGIRSRVLRGTLHDQAVDWDCSVWGVDNCWRMWEVRPAGQGLPDKPHIIERGSEAGDLAIYEGEPRIVYAGDWYEIPKRTFHATRAVGTTVTMMKKIDEEDAWARLLVPRGFDPIHSLSKQPDASFIKNEMIRAVEGIGEVIIEDTWRELV